MCSAAMGVNGTVGSQISTIRPLQGSTPLYALYEGYLGPHSERDDLSWGLRTQKTGGGAVVNALSGPVRLQKTPPVSTEMCQLSIKFS